MSNFDIAQNALQTSLDSSGSAMREHERWSQSLEAKLLKLKATWQSLSQSFMNSDFLKGVLDGIIALVNGIDNLISSAGTFPTLLTGFTLFRSLFNNNGIFRTLNTDLKGFTNNLGFANKSISELMNTFNSGKTGSGFKGFISGLKSVGTSLKATLSDADLSAINQYIDLIDNQGVSHQDAFAQSMQDTSAAAQDMVNSAKGNTQALKGMTKATSGVKTGLIGAKIAAVAFNAALTMGIALLIDWAISGVSKLINASKDLAESVDEVTSKYKEQHDSLKKIYGDYDTSNESSMISKYDKLSKGVDSLGRNVSLTANEYSEYQSIVGKIADQFPSLIIGYDSQGNAILSCKGNVEELTAAYEKLIHIQNQEILTNTKDIENDFSNAVKDKTGTGWFDTLAKDYTNLPIWKKFLMSLNPVTGLSQMFNAHNLFADHKMTTGTAKVLDDLLNTDRNNIGDKIRKYDEQTLFEIQTALEDAGVDVGFLGKNTAEALEETLKNEPAKIRGIVDNFYGECAETIEHQKTIATAKLSEAFDVSSAISGLNYDNISEELQTIAYQTVNSLDFDFFSDLSEKGKSVESWVTEMLDQLNSLSKGENSKIEAAFDLQTKFNGGDITYGEYVNSLKDIQKVIDKADLKEEVKSQLELSLGLDEDGVVKEYEHLLNRLTSKEIGLNDNAVRKFLDGLSSEELSVLMSVVPDLDAGTTIKEIQSIIDEQMATEFKFDIEVQTAGIDALNTALSESRSAIGLTTDSIEALRGRYEDLDGFNAAALFEETANGIHLNNEELSRLEELYINTNKLNIDSNLNKLITKYNDLTEKIKLCTDAQEKESLQLQADTYKDKIEELSIISSQYDGLTSAFSKWQNALNGAEEGDNYDSLYENLESIKELYDKGLVGTDKFKTSVQLMSDEDLSNASIDKLVSAYKEGYPKMKRYFTEGQKGCKNFLNDVSKLNSEWAHMNKDGSWEINFNAEEVAKELGVSVDFVLQIAKKLKDYGFEVNLEDSSVDNLKTKIEETEAKLKKLGQAPVDINVDIEASSENLGTIEAEIEKAKAKIQEINNSSVEPNVKTAQLEDARAKLEVLIDKKIEASQPAFMSLNTSQVSASLVDALEKVQAYQNAIDEVNKLNELKEAGIKIDDSQIATAKEKVDECAKAIQGLDGDVKLAIGLEEDGSIDSIKKAFEEGKVKIDANTDPALTKIEQLAENVERIEDKDVTINVTVNGLDEVKELNKQIDLATHIEGSIDSLSEYVESAKVLSDLEDNITSFVNAEIKGNVVKTPEYQLNNLEVFAKGANELKETGSFSSSVTADINGNVVDSNMTDEMLDNLKIFAEGAKELKNVDSVNVVVKAQVDGNVEDFLMTDRRLDNLKVFAEGVKSLQDVKNVDVTVKAQVDGNAEDFLMTDGRLDNLQVFADGAKALKDVDDVDVTVKANAEGDAIWHPEGMLNNLNVFAEGAKLLKDVENVDVTVKAQIDGNVEDILMTNGRLDNLQVFADGIRALDGLEDVDVTVTARINTTAGLGGRGNGTESDVTSMFEEQLDNLQIFADGAKALDGVSDVDVTVSANIEGNVEDILMTNGRLDNLQVFADGIRALDGLKDVNVTVTANVDGDVVWRPEFMLNNLNAFANGAKELSDIEDVTRTVTANVNGDAIWHPEFMLNNLETFTEGAKELSNIEDVNRTVTANVNGNAIWNPEFVLNNLNTFAEGAKLLKDVDDVDVTVTAKLNTKLGEADATDASMLGRINNLKTFAEGARLLNGVGDVSTTVTAKAEGNVITGENASNNLSSLTEFKSLVSGMSNQTVSISVTANVDSEKINSAITLLKSVANSGVFKDYNATVQVGAKISTIDDSVVDLYQAPPKEGKVSYSVDENSSVYTWSAPDKDGVVNYSAEVEALTSAQKYKTGTITYKAKFEGFGIVNGTANINGSAFSNGTSGKAFKHGDWGVKKTETALTGELGPELVVYKNRYWTVGDNGAEFATIPRGAIVFNHRQTEELLANGRVTSDGGRGRAFAEGNARIEGTAYVDGKGKFYNSVTGSSYGSKDSKDKNDTEETFDWIETAISRVERAIDRLDTKANSAYRSWSERNKALTQEISKIQEEIELQEAAMKEYQKAANGVNLSSSYVNKIKNGTLDIETITDEVLKEKISDYDKWYEKILECQDAILDLQEKEADLFKQRFDDTATEYENMLSVIEHEKNMLDEYISQSEASGMLVSEKYYDALVKNTNSTISKLQEEKSALLSELQTAMASGNISKYDPAWYEMVNAIDDVTLSIAENQTQIKKWQQSIQQLSWEKFDLLQEKISSVTEEADFLIELMSNKKLFDDKGQLTDEGIATLGLHGQSYNVNMYQADLAAQEAARLKSELAKDPYDTELEARYREMIALQQEYILGAEAEKNAIKDLVEEGIETEISALEELISKKVEELNAERDLYEYSKKIRDITAEIASLEKQRAAYSGDDSDEGKAKLQQIELNLKDAREELAETETDRLIENTEKLLDELLIEYQNTLNSRLDNIDYLVSDMITQINANAGTISETLTLAADNVGYTLSSSMQQTWSSSTANINGVISMYGDRFTSNQTSSINALNAIRTNLNSMISQLNAIAATNVKSASTSSAAKSTQANTNKTPVTNTSTNQPTTNTETAKTIKVGGKINAGNAPIYDYAGAPAERQLYRNDPIYTVLSERNGYILTRYHKLSSGYTGWFKKSDVKALATGKKNIPENDIAWTQEQGQEFIVRPSDGAILTPVAKCDSVLNANASSNIWKMANSPAEFIKDNLSLSNTDIPSSSNVNNNYTQHFDSIEFVMPNVKNYDEMLFALKDDKRFEKLILAMSIDRLAGKSSLAKGKVIK